MVSLPDPIRSHSVLRPATLADVPQIAALERLPHSLDFVVPWSEEEHLQALTTPTFRYYANKGYAGQIQGFVLICGIEQGCCAIEIHRIVVRNPGKGLGRAMLRSVMAIAFEEFSAHRIWLDVFENNSWSRLLFEGLGFVYEGVQREAVLRDGKYESLLRMSILDREYAQHTH